MSAMSTRKGKVYERLIASKLRARFGSDTVDIRRTSQADRAANSDVIATGHPVLERLWLEIQDARKPTPDAKLLQAERDIAGHEERGGSTYRLPVVIWHRLGERTHQVTTRLWVLDDLRRLGSTDCWHGDTTCTLDLVEFIEIVCVACGEVKP